MELKQFIKEWTDKSDNSLESRLVYAEFEKDNQFVYIRANYFEYHEEDADINMPEYITFYLLINGVAVYIANVSLALITRVD